MAPPPGTCSTRERLGLCCQLHPLPSHWVLDFLAQCFFSPCLLPHIPSEDYGLESSAQGHPYCYRSLDGYCCLLCCTKVHGHISGDYSGWWYDYCLICSGSKQPLTGWSGTSSQPSAKWFGGHCSPSPYPVLGLLILVSTFWAAVWAGNMIYQGCCIGIYCYTVTVIVMLFYYIGSILLYCRVMDIPFHPVEEVIPEVLLGL